MKDFRNLSVAIDLPPDRMKTLVAILEREAPRDKEAEQFLAHILARTEYEIRRLPDVDTYCIETSSHDTWQTYSPSRRQGASGYGPELSFPLQTHREVVKRGFWKNFKIDIDRLSDWQRLSILTEDGFVPVPIPQASEVPPTPEAMESPHP